MTKTSGTRFTKTDTDADGVGVYCSAALNERGLRLQVWRQAGGGWSWGLVWGNGHELPADSGASTRHEAQREAAAWWQLHGQDGIDNVRKMYLGRWRAFLVNTSERTVKSTKATRRLAEQARNAAELEAPIATPAEAAEAPAAELARPFAEPGVMMVAAARGQVRVTIEGDRLVMEGPSGRHSVLLDYDCGTGVARDRALIHLAGFLHTNGATQLAIATALARVELDGVGIGVKDPDQLGRTFADLVLGLRDLRKTNGQLCTSSGRGGRIAQLVAWHVGIAGAPVLA